LTSLLIAAAGYTFHVTPDSNAPGAHGIQQAINVFAVYALMAAATGFLLGAATWAIGGRVGNEFTAVGGKLGMVASLAVAFLVGSAATSSTSRSGWARCLPRPGSRPGQRSPWRRL
jgi:hypothetical protein